MKGILWIASYPRSGNTWTRLLLESYMRQGAPQSISMTSMLFSTSSIPLSFTIM